MPVRDVVLVLIICVVWAGNFLTSAAAMQEFPPFLFTALRLALLAVVLVPFLRPAAPGQWPRLLTMALCNGALHFGLSFWALHAAGNLASPAIVMQTYVPITALLAWLWLGEQFGPRTAAGITLSFVGVLVLGFDPMVLERPEAVLAMLTAACFLSVGTILMRGLDRQDLYSVQGWTALIGLAPLLLLSAWFEPTAAAAFRSASWLSWGGVAYSALLSSLLGHGLYYQLIRRHPVTTVTPYLLLTPLLAILLGVLFWGDQPGPRLLMGGALVLSGVLAVALRARARHRPVAPASDA
ncbi:MAG TPA: EamA family transporter [Xanthomonadales bacterium]|nr:EamA family transporter [Xanthomonadales bacterium]